MKVRLTALSINSIHIKTTMAFRRVNAPITPIVKSMALRIRYKAGGTAGITMDSLLIEKCKL
jgi:hypothetical protein